MSELKVNDIFCHELRLKGREAFLVKKVELHHIVVTSRSDNSKNPKPIKKAKEGSVIFLRKLN